MVGGRGIGIIERKTAQEDVVEEEDEKEEEENEEEGEKELDEDMK